MIGADAILKSDDVTLENYLKPFPLVVEDLNVDIKQLKRLAKVRKTQKKR